jgi:hypothetical protein
MPFTSSPTARSVSAADRQLIDQRLSLPLDGSLRRGPYRHNGSAPSLRDLLPEPYEGDESELLSELPGALI